MKKKSRKDERFEDIGRVEACDICALPGVLDDISLSGCRIHFPNPVTLDLENDYELKIKFVSREGMEPLSVIAHPQWKEIEESETTIGFKILCSPDTPQLKAYIESLISAKEESEEDISDLLIESSAKFI